MKKNQRKKPALRLLSPVLAALILVLAATALISCQTAPKKKPADVFTVHWDSPRFQIGEVEVQVNTVLGLSGKLKKLTVPVFYFPQEDAVVLRFRPEFTTYQQCWSGRGRLDFIEALNKYNEDYDARVLEERNRKSSRKYGLVQGYLIWQQFQYTIRARGTMNMELGYAFKDRAPYFQVNMLSAEYIDEISRDSNRTSPVLPMFYTRAQAADLAALFNREYLDDLTRSGTIPNVRTDMDDDY